MKQNGILTLGVLLACACVAYAAFPTHSNVATSDLSKITGNVPSFRAWRWAGYDTQECTIYVENPSGTAVTLAGYSVCVKIAQKTESGQTAYISLAPSDVTVSSSHFTWTTPYTNVPPNGTYDAEAWAFEGSSTQQAR